MSDTSTVKVAQIAGILTSAFASGGILSISFLTIPGLTVPARNSKSGQQPGTPLSHLTHQWLHIYDTGKFVFPSIALTSVLFYSYVAYAVRGVSGGRLSRLYLTAAALTITIAPYTIGLMMPTNKRLEAHATREDEAQDKGKDAEEESARREVQDREVPALLAKWTRLNAVRGIFPLLGAALGAAVSFGLV